MKGIILAGGSGTRLKVFADIAFLSGYMPLAAMLDGYERKYPAINGMMALKSLSYFDDIDHSAEVDFIDEEINWETIRTRIQQMLKDPVMKFRLLSSKR